MIQIERAAFKGENTDRVGPWIYNLISGEKRMGLAFIDGVWEVYDFQTKLIKPCEKLDEALKTAFDILENGNQDIKTED